ncbi:MAG: aldehyde dehydrogenase family protein [Chitinophagaceae bacterium]
MESQALVAHLDQMRLWHATGATSAYSWRKHQLTLLKKALYSYEEPLYEALYTDLKKNKEEAWITEIGFTIAEINFALKHLPQWMAPQRVATNIINLPGKSYILSEPMGVVLIIGPWNYPLQLLLAPLVGALAAGNCVVLKPSELAPATALVLQQMIDEIFSGQYVKVIQGAGNEVIPGMMNHFRFDHVFYTGSTEVGKLVYEMAATKLVPVTLELGGKCPCIIERDADIKVAAKRIAFIKFSNAGQMCVAPDYLLVHEDVREAFIKELAERIHDYYVADEYHSGKLIGAKAFNRLVQYLQEGDVIYGGKVDHENGRISPTLLENIAPDAAIMKEEIFGPLLPVLTWKEEDEVYKIIQKNNNPLALYVFTGSEAKAKKWTTTIPFGGGCINNAGLHLTNHNLPFGGRGNSGTGAYHGKYSFNTFSHKKGILKTPTWFDPSFKYPSFKGKLNLFKRFMK